MNTGLTQSVRPSFQSCGSHHLSVDRDRESRSPTSKGDKNKTDYDNMYTRSLVVNRSTFNRYLEQQIHQSRSESDDGLGCAAIFPSTLRTSREVSPTPSPDRFVAILPTTTKLVRSEVSDRPAKKSLVREHRLRNRRRSSADPRTFDKGSPQTGRRELIIG